MSSFTQEGENWKLKESSKFAYEFIADQAVTHTKIYTD